MTFVPKPARWKRIVAVLGAIVATALFVPWWCGRDANAWFTGDTDRQRALADEMVEFELRDDEHRITTDPSNRFAEEWELVTHQMIALGLAQICLARADDQRRYAPAVTRAALKTFLPEIRDFGTRPWHEDAMARLDSNNGHAYLGYAALAIGMARLVDAEFPLEIARQHDALIAAYERRLLASPTGLIETYPGEAYPTDVAAVAAAIAVHGRVTHSDHSAVLRHWSESLEHTQRDSKSGLLIQRMKVQSGAPQDAPRGSGTALGAYFAGFVDQRIAKLLTQSLFAHQAEFLGFGGIREYAEGYSGWGDVDSGPVLLGVSVAATGFALAPARAFGMRGPFEQLYRTTDLFGVPVPWRGRFHFATGGAIGNALMLALLTSGPELAP